MHLILGFSFLFDESFGLGFGFMLSFSLFCLYLVEQVHAYYRFGPLSVYLSVNYLDRFLSACELSVSCGEVPNMHFTKMILIYELILLEFFE